MSPTKFSTGSKTFEITGYSFTKCLGDLNFIQSDRFTVGGYDWALDFYPNGSTKKDHVAAGIRLLTDEKVAKAVHAFYLKDVYRKKWIPMVTADDSPLLTYSTVKDINGFKTWIRDSLIKRSDFEMYYLRDDTLEIKCTLWVSE